jgi:hypothetical protein
LGGRLCSGLALRQPAGGAASARNPQKSMDFWRASRDRDGHRDCWEISIVL